MGFYQKDHNIVITNHQGSLREHLESEDDTFRRHRVGSLHNNDGRRAGFLHHHEEFGLYNIDEQERDKSGSEDIQNVRDIIHQYPDWKLIDPKHHTFQRYCIGTTEQWIKEEQEGMKKIKKMEAEKKEKEEVNDKENEVKKDEKETAKNDEKADKDNNQKVDNDKDKDKDSQKVDNDKAKTKDDQKVDNDKDRGNNKDKDKDKDSKKVDKDKAKDNQKDNQNNDSLIEDDKKTTESDKNERKRNQPENEKSDDKEQEGKKLSPEDKWMLDEIVAETEHLESLVNNDGKGNSPIKEGKFEITIDEQDQFGPDNWIPRSSSLIRLTGKVPLNAEPDLSSLFSSGLITPTRLHYVRNHGEVPKLDWDTHTLEVFADPPELIQESRTFTMNEISEMESINIPVFLACDGNRRKEINMIKRSKGFNWGPGAVSCVYWRGVLVRDILIACGVKNKPISEKWYIHYEGADNLSEGRYATSVPFEYVMDPINDVMLAYEMNNRPLHPDHGYPLRSIIPGFVGGRCVKWLAKMWISKLPSDNHYHIYDNRVLPAFVTDVNSDIADAFFNHPDTACNEQILNSVICCPTHDETIKIADIKDKRTYRVAGYAYCGGGSKVERVEISLDGGKNWQYCFRRFPEKPLRHGKKWWTWAHWHRNVSLDDLLNCKEIIVRAHNAFKDTQPEHPTFNIMGMMNNCWYRVQIKFQHDENGELELLFQHPVVPGTDDGGWMKPSADVIIDKKESEKNTPEKQFTAEEVAKHDKETDAWIVLNNKVYDVTSVLSWHPGGKHAIMEHAGKIHMETTWDYNSIHDDYATSKASECCIGALSANAIKALQEDADRRSKILREELKKEANEAIQQHRWTPIKLIEKKEVSRDTRIFKFQLPEKARSLNLPVGKHIQIGIHFKDKMVIRPYTPIWPVSGTEDKEDGTFQLLIKVYFPGDPHFPPGGTVTNYLDEIDIGEQVDVKGPLGDIEYCGNGKFNIENKERHYRKMSLIAGGTGITPHYQLIRRIVPDQNDPTQISILFTNKTAGDILLREEMESYAEKFPDKFKLWLIISEKPENEDWKYGIGHADEKAMKDHLFPPCEDTVALLCGPPAMLEKAVVPVLNDWGYKSDENLFGF